MKGLETGKTRIRQQVFAAIARLAYEGGNLSRIDQVPYKIVPGEVARYRDSIFRERAIVTERLRLADGRPGILETDRYPESFSFLFGEDLNDKSLYKLLKEKYGIAPHHSSKTIDLVFADAAEAKELGVAKGYPLLRIQGAVHDEAETVTILSTQLCLGDRFKLIV